MPRRAAGRPERIPPSAPAERTTLCSRSPLLLAALARAAAHGPGILVLVALLAAAPACSSVPGEPRGGLAGVADRTWRGGAEVDLGPTGTALGIVSPGGSYRTRQYESQTPTERRVVAVSRDRGATDILFARSPSDGAEVVVYLTAEDGILVRAIQQKGAGAPTEVPRAAAERDFQVQKDFWLRRLGASAP